MFVNDRFQLNTKSYLPSLQNYEKKQRPQPQFPEKENEIAALIKQVKLGFRLFTDRKRL